MSVKKAISRVLSVLLFVLMMSSTASARPLSAAPGTGFTYQGSLTDGSAPANGKYDLEFRLYDALTSGGQVGGTVSLGDVIVTNGLFTVLLDFGNVFDGTALYLEISVRPGASIGAYTILAPRQQLTAAPYALFAKKAPWTGLTGVPAGFADGVDNNTTYTAGDGLELVGTQFKGKGTPYQNVIIVAKSGGDFTTITDALNSIADASDTNRYLVYVAPGVYTEQVSMLSYIDIEGAGESATRITYTGDALGNSGTLMGVSMAELRYLTVENTGGAASAIAIYNLNAYPSLIHVTANASGGTISTYGVYNYQSSPTMTDVTASAWGGPNNRGVNNDTSSPLMTNVAASAWGVDSNYGVYNYNSSPTMANVTAYAWDGANTNFGVANENSSPVMTDVTASGSGGSNNRGVDNLNSSPVMTNVTASASWGTDHNYGVFNTYASPVMANVTASARGGTNYNEGVVNDNSSPMMMNVSVSASGGFNSIGVSNRSSSPTINNSLIRAYSATYNYGIANFAPDGTYTVHVNNSQISGDTNTIQNDAEFTTLVGASQLSGGPVDAGGGTVICAGVYDQAYTFYASTCP